jgi:hypothetical protein
MFIMAPNAERRIFRLLSIFRLFNGLLLYARPNIVNEYPLMRQCFSVRCEVKEGELSDVEGLGSQYEVPTFKQKVLGRTKVKVKITLRLAVYRQSVRLDVKYLETHDLRFFFQLSPCGNTPYVTSSLTRRWVCLL